MSGPDEYFHYSGLTYARKVEISEKAALDPTSNIYAKLKMEFAAKLAKLKEMSEDKANSGRRRRIVVPFTVLSEQMFELCKEFAQYDLVFKSTERRDGAYARSVAMIVAERLFDRIRGRWVSVLAYGVSLNSIVVHNRSWVHLCVPGGRAEIRAATLADDRAMCAVLNASSKKNKSFPLKDRYAKGDLSSILCNNSESCRIQGEIAVMMLDRVDTSYLQLAHYMRVHGVSLLYFAIPCCKAMEFCYDAEFPELEATVRASGSKIELLYKNAVGMAQVYTHSNYLTLIAKTHEKLGDMVYYKEFCDLQCGYATFKVTCSKALPDFDRHVYRTWLTPGYKTKYMVKSYDLISNVSDVFDARSYVPYNFEVEREPLDKLLEYAMSVEGADLTHELVSRKLRSMVCVTVHGGYDMVYGGLALDEKQCMHLSLVVFVRCFMQKYVTGVTLSKLTSEDKDLQYLRRAGALSLVPFTVVWMFHCGVTRPLHKLAAAVRICYDWLVNRNSVELPSVEEQVGFTEYKQSLRPTLWEDCKSWVGIQNKPWETFDPYLPGGAEAASVQRYYMSACTDSRFGTNHALVKDLEQAMGDGHAGHGRLLTDEIVARGPLVDTESTQLLAKKIVADNEGLVDLRVTELKHSVGLIKSQGFMDSHNGLVTNPVAVLRRTLGNIFPGSTLMQTDQVGSDTMYGPVTITAKTVSLKIDASKFKAAKPERVFRPMIANQVLPDVKQEPMATLQTLAKRNMNTTSSADPLDVDALWGRTWTAMKQVYYVGDVEERLASMEYIGPTAETAAVWASKLTESAKEASLGVDFSRQQLDLETNKLMLKGKRKINLGASYATAVKPSQSIQYDSTRSRTGVYSPIFAEKVRRDKSVLRDDVFVMQSKSPEDMNQFLGNFDWRDNGKGALRYLEIDGELFDKSQIVQTLMMHWKKCEVFGVLPSYLHTLEHGTQFRSASSVAAGIKVYITPMRGSGDSDTLDGNCDVSMAAYAKFFLGFRDQIEFIMICGDDVTVAVRGDVDIMHAEADCMREFNLSVKISISDYGYFVSGFIVHLPGGVIKWVTDPVKRAVSLGNQSVTELTSFEEKFVSMADLCKGLEGYACQQYLADAISLRYGQVLGVSYDRADVIDTIKAVVTVATNYEDYRSAFAEATTKRYL